MIPFPRVMTCACLFSAITFLLPVNYLQADDDDDNSQSSSSSRLSVRSDFGSIPAGSVLSFSASESDVSGGSESMFDKFLRAYASDSSSSEESPEYDSLSSWRGQPAPADRQAQIEDVARRHYNQIPAERETIEDAVRNRYSQIPSERSEPDGNGDGQYQRMPVAPADISEAETNDNNAEQRPRLLRADRVRQDLSGQAADAIARRPVNALGRDMNSVVSLDGFRGMRSLGMASAQSLVSVGNQPYGDGVPEHQRPYLNGQFANLDGQFYDPSGNVIRRQPSSWETADSQYQRIPVARNPYGEAPSENNDNNSPYEKLSLVTANRIRALQDISAQLEHAASSESLDLDDDAGSEEELRRKGLRYDAGEVDEFGNVTRLPRLYRIGDEGDAGNDDGSSPSLREIPYARRQSLAESDDGSDDSLGEAEPRLRRQRTLTENEQGNQYDVLPREMVAFRDQQQAAEQERAEAEERERQRRANLPENQYDEIPAEMQQNRQVQDAELDGDGNLRRPGRVMAEGDAPDNADARRLAARVIAADAAESSSQSSISPLEQQRRIAMGQLENTPNDVLANRVQQTGMDMDGNGRVQRLTRFFENGGQGRQPAYASSSSSASRRPRSNADAPRPAFGGGVMTRPQQQQAAAGAQTAGGAAASNDPAPDNGNNRQPVRIRPVASNDAGQGDQGGDNADPRRRPTRAGQDQADAPDADGPGKRPVPKPKPSGKK